MSPDRLSAVLTLGILLFLLLWVPLLETIRRVLAPPRERSRGPVVGEEARASLFS